MIVVTGVFELDPQHVARLKEAAGIMAQATRQEDGCQAYAFWQDIEKPTRFRVYEEWDSQDALDAHFETEHMQVWRAALGQGGILSREIFRIVGGVKEPL